MTFGAAHIPLVAVPWRLPASQSTDADAGFFLRVDES
jgi:hypothetical protein